MFTGGINMRQLRRLLISSIAFLFCFIISLPTLAQERLSEIIKKIEPSTVVILTYDKDGNIISQGSGFFISKNGDIITSRHVLAGAYSAGVKTINGKIYPITLIVAEDKEADLIRASVNIPVESVYPLPISSSIPEVGERVAVIGSPLGLERTVSDGIISAVRDIPAFGKIYQITAPISPGSSGSPVVNMKGEVIGVATFQFVEGQNLNFAIPGERIAKLKTEKGKTLDEWKMGKTEEWLDSAEGLYYAGLIFLWADDYEKALPYFENAAKKDPLFAEAYFQIGFCNGSLGRYTEAIQAYKQAIRIKPDLAEAHYNLGWAYAKLGRYTEAIEASKQAIRIKPDYAEAHYNLGGAYGRLGRYTEAIEAYNQAIRIKPDFAEAHYNLGAAYDEFGRHTEAIQAFKQAIRIKPDYADAHYGLGVAYAKLGRYTEAIQAFKQAIRIKPDYAKAHYNLGVAYLFIGDRGSALDEYKILKNLDNNLANRLFNLIYK
jgi:tetratricopeptide (TPR) repeat protein